MHIQLFLAACLLGTVLASPIPEDTCKSEMKRFDKCIKKYDHGIPKWWDDTFLEKLFPLQAWKDCVGEAKCDRVKKINELSENLYNLYVYLNKNLRTCLGNGTLEKFDNMCNKYDHTKLPCDDQMEFDCIISKMKENESCDSQDAKAFDAIVPQLVRIRNLVDETHGGRKCEGTKDGYKKTEIPKSFFRITLSSFLDIVREIFKR